MEVVSNEVYNSITIKSITNSVQRVIMYRPEYPNGVVSFYPTRARQILSASRQNPIHESRR